MAEKRSFGTNRLMSHIPQGRENAKSRADLAYEMQMSDRSVRQLIEDARNEGCIILNDQTGRGYYTSDNLDDLERQYRQDTARALSILKRRKAIRAKLKAAGRQV